MIGHRDSSAFAGLAAFAIGTRARQAEERDARERERARASVACVRVMRLTRRSSSSRCGDFQTPAWGVVEPKTRGDVETFRARAVALGIDLCVDATIAREVRVCVRRVMRRF